MEEKVYADMNDAGFMDSFLRARDLVSGIEDELINKYFEGEGSKYKGSQASNSIVFPLAQILYFSEEVKDKRILDLGCGAKGKYSISPDLSRMYEPWLCRGLLELGAIPVGIDNRSNEEEHFENYQANLFDEDSLSEISDNSIDIAHARGLFNDPSVYLSSAGDLKNLINPQLERVVKPSGLFIYEE